MLQDQFVLWAAAGLVLDDLNKALNVLVTVQQPLEGQAINHGNMIAELALYCTQFVFTYPQLCCRITFIYLLLAFHLIRTVLMHQQIANSAVCF